MTQTITYRTKLTQVEGDLKATVIAKHLLSGLAVVSRPLDSEDAAKAEAHVRLIQNLKALDNQGQANSRKETRNDNHVVESF